MSAPVLRALTYTFSSDLTCSTARYRAGSSHMADDQGVKQNKV